MQRTGKFIAFCRRFRFHKLRGLSSVLDPTVCAGISSLSLKYPVGTGTPEISANAYILTIEYILCSKSKKTLVSDCDRLIHKL